MGSSYSSLADNLIKFHELGELPFRSERLDEGNGIEVTMMNNNARYHQSCRLRYNNTKLHRAEKKAQSEEYNTSMGCMHTRSKCTDTSSTKEICFFCGKPPSNIGIHEAAKFRVNERVYACAVLLEESELLA